MGIDIAHAAAGGNTQSFQMADDEIAELEGPRSSQARRYDAIVERWRENFRVCHVPLA
jgi:hypothetical protein